MNIESGAYDPFASGQYRACVRTIQLPDSARGRVFPCEIWYPAVADDAHRSGTPAEIRDVEALPGAHPLVVFSHSSGGNRLSSTFLCTHLASHGYVVAALDHSEVVAAELVRRDGESQAERARRTDAVISARVPDVRFLLDGLLERNAGLVPLEDVRLDAERVGLVGHSFGGWTVLATPDVDARVRAVVALAPGGSTHPRPGILPLTLEFDWGRDIPTLILAAEYDTPIPLEDVADVFNRVPASKHMFILRRADHQHFVDDVEGEHEAIRAMSLPGEAAWIPLAMRPMKELCSGEQAHVFARGLTLAHLDKTLRQMQAAERFLAGDVERELATHGVEAVAHRP